MAAKEVARTKRVPVSDPLRAAADPSLPTVRRAIDPAEAGRRLNTACLTLVARCGPLRLRAIRVTRLKPGRRCVIEYDVWFPAGGKRRSLPEMTIIGKVRAKGADRTTPGVLAALRAAGFGAHSRDQISVPAPLGVIPELAMWLQEKVSGVPAGQLLKELSGVALAERIAEAARKLHRSSVPAPRRHTMADELRILHERLPRVAHERPELKQRLRRVLAACDRLGASVPAPRACCIHRDFYGAHVLVDGQRLWLLDFDLFCEGDPALDAGNFIGHITEEGLRHFGDASAMSDRERALEQRFLELHGGRLRRAVRAYTTFTLVRHIHLSTLFPDRVWFTERLLELCEERLADA